MRDRSAANRLAHGDESFHWMRRNLGVVNSQQIVWWFDYDYPVDNLEQIHRGLSAGQLSRLLVRSRVPLARSRWIPAPPVHPLITEEEPVTDVLAWADRHGQPPLDLERGPGWLLATAPVAGGGRVVTFVSPHDLSDGLGRTAAVQAALSGTSPGVLPDDTPEASIARWRDDWADAANRVIDAGRAVPKAVRLAKELRSRSRDSQSGPDVETTSCAPGPPRPQARLRELLKSPIWEQSDAAVDIPRADWETAARQRGGTNNSLLIGFLAGLLYNLGWVKEGEHLRLVIPINTRAGVDDLRGNTLSGVTIEVPITAGLYDDLTPIRAITKAALKSASDGPHARQLEVIRAMMPFVPKFGAMAARPGTATPLHGTASYLGELAADMLNLGEAPVWRVLCRAWTGPTPAAYAEALGGAFTVFMGEYADRVCLDVMPMRPSAGTRAELNVAIAEECRKWGLKPDFWTDFGVVESSAEGTHR